MSDNDLIQKGDAALAVLQNFTETAQLEAINTLPAVQPTVKPLEWFEVEKYRYGGKYTSEGYTIRYIEGFFLLDFAGNGKTVWRFPTLEAAKAAAQADYEARILSALEWIQAVLPHATAKVQALVVALEKLDVGEGWAAQIARDALAAWKDATR